MDSGSHLKKQQRVACAFFISQAHGSNRWLNATCGLRCAASGEGATVLLVMLSSSAAQLSCRFPDEEACPFCPTQTQPMQQETKRSRTEQLTASSLCLHPQTGAAAPHSGLDLAESWCLPEHDVTRSKRLGWDTTAFGRETAAENKSLQGK